MMRFLKSFERIVAWTLTVMMALVLVLATIDLAQMIVKDVLRSPVLVLAVTDLLDIFGLFLLVLIGIELLETIRTYLVEHLIRVEVVFMVALIAIARKVIILEVSAYPSLTLVGIGAIILALAIGYYLIRRSHKEREYPVC